MSSLPPLQQPLRFFQQAITIGRWQWRAMKCTSLPDKASMAPLKLRTLATGDLKEAKYAMTSQTSQTDTNRQTELALLAGAHEDRNQRRAFGRSPFGSSFGEWNCRAGHNNVIMRSRP
jgi:hypothetical protein